MEFIPFGFENEILLYVLYSWVIDLGEKKFKVTFLNTSFIAPSLVFRAPVRILSLNNALDLTV